MDYYERNVPDCTEETLADAIADSERVFTLAGDADDHACTDVYIVQPGDTYYGIAAKLGITVYQLSGLNPFVNPDAIEVNQRLCIPLLQPDSDEIIAAVEPGEIPSHAREHEPPGERAAPKSKAQNETMLTQNHQKQAAQHLEQPEARYLKMQAESQYPDNQPEMQSHEQKSPYSLQETTSATESIASNRHDYTTMTMPHGWSFYNILVRYGVSYDALQRANPGVDLEALAGGQAIYVPPAGSRGLTDERGFETHIVERFETLDSISRKYRVSTANLLKNNPNLTPHDFIVGRVILVPDVR